MNEANVSMMTRIIVSLTTVKVLHRDMQNGIRGLLKCGTKLPRIA